MGTENKVFEIIKNTKAYNLLKADKNSGTLSHAYLLLCEDVIMLKEYAKIFAKLIMCSSSGVCGGCRTCTLINSEKHTDVIFYPQDKKIKVADIDDLVKKSYLKPYECDKKLFVLLSAQDMNTQAQNKLLKTLEEPPENTHILIVATNTYSLLPTIVSRVKQLTIEPFSNEIVASYLKEFNYEKDTSFAIALAGGKLGEAKSRMESGEGVETENLVFDILLNLDKGSQLYKFNNKVNKDNVKDFIDIIANVLWQASRCKLLGEYKDEKIKQIADKYAMGTLLDTFESVKLAEKSYKFNGNSSAIFDIISFGLLGGKNKWQK